MNGARMQHTSVLLGSLKETLFRIWKNRGIFFVLLVLQIIFFSWLSMVNFNYQIRILEDSKAITDYLSKLRLDEASMASDVLAQKNLLGDDPLMISRHFNEIKKNFAKLMIYVFVLLVIFTTVSWAFSFQIMRGTDFRHMPIVMFRIFVILLAYLGAIFLFFYALFSIPMSDLLLQSSGLLTKLVPVLLVTVILAYFMIVSLSLSQKYRLSEIPQKTIVIGLKKINYILSAHLINFSVIILPFLGLIYFREGNLFFLAVFILGFIYLCLISNVCYW